MKQEIRLATRESALALAQTTKVAQELEVLFPSSYISIHKMKTKGDKILDVALSKIGGKGLFTKELEVALCENRADIAVHSLKDVPVALPSGLALTGYMTRENASDAFVSNKYKRIADLPKNAVVGTSSLRRQVLLQQVNPNIEIRELRGNVQTRLAKLDSGAYDAIILASAGLHRLGLQDRIAGYLPIETWIPAVGQGIVALETYESNPLAQEIAKKLTTTESYVSAIAERAFLATLQGGCQVPLGCHCVVQGNSLTLYGFIGSLQYKQALYTTQKGTRDEGQDLGIAAAQHLLEQGGAAFLKEVGIDI